MYSASDIARYILWYCASIGEPISNLKLQKILYLVWIDYCRDTEGSLFGDDICAWRFGPVIPAVYFCYSHYACLKIYAKEKPTYSDTLNFLDRYIDRYCHIPISELSERICSPGTPWHRAYSGREGYRLIPLSLLREYAKQR